MPLVMECVANDMKMLENGSIGDVRASSELYLYGFIAAALRGDPMFRGQASRSKVIQLLDRRRKSLLFFSSTSFRALGRVLDRLLLMANTMNERSIYER